MIYEQIDILAQIVVWFFVVSSAQVFFFTSNIRPYAFPFKGDEASSHFW